MRKLGNSITITGILVSKSFEEFTTKKGDEAIGGTLKIRTADKSEHEVQFYSNKYKKDSKELSYFYNYYVKANEELVSLADTDDYSMVSIVKIADASFSANDFKGKDGNIVSTNRLNGRFINVVDSDKRDTTLHLAEFDVEGVISSISDEIKGDNPTGNLIVNVMAFAQVQKDYNDKNSYELSSLIPIKFVVEKGMAGAFKSAGFYEGAFSRFSGKLINTIEVKEKVIKAAFGNDIIEKYNNTLRRYELCSASTPSTIYDVDGMTDDIIAQLKSQRNAKLDEIKNGKTETQTGFETLPPQMSSNPFA